MDATLTSKQKKRLHEVADLMLQIFRTLARMRYLEPEWIEPGPHDISGLMSLYESLNIDPAIIYLYSILPYLKPEADRIHIFHGGEFVDFRNRRDVEHGRDPMYGSDPELMMRPWMTPLSAVGNHYTALIYDAKRHSVGVYNQMDTGTSDPNYYEGFVCARLNDKGERIAYFKRREDGTEEPCDVSEWEALQNASSDSSDDSDDEEEDDDENEDDDEDESNEEDVEKDEDINHWDEMDARRAGNVLRDINRWYLDLFEVSGGETDGGMWYREIVEPLYRKHGWPGEDFDGDAFLADKARAEAAASIKDDAEAQLQRLEMLRRQLEWQKKEKLVGTREKLAAATTVSEEWVVRWEIWQVERMIQSLQTDIEKEERFINADGGRGAAEDLPLWALKKVQMDLFRTKQRLEQLKMAAADPQTQDETRSLEKTAAIYEKVYAASLDEAERLCPGKAPFLLDIGEDINTLTTRIVDSDRHITDIKVWIAQLPDGAIEARKLAGELAEELKGSVELWSKMRQDCVDELKKHLRETSDGSRGYDMDRLRDALAFAGHTDGPRLHDEKIHEALVLR
jgi:hypothetical protein